VNATNNFNERKASNTLTRLAPIERMEMEGIAVTNKLMALPFFIITFSMTALVTLSVCHLRLTEQHHNFVVALTMFSSVAMLLGLVHFLRSSHRALLIYSVSCALFLGILAPLGW
jgi:hypothetical protein